MCSPADERVLHEQGVPRMCDSAHRTHDNDSDQVLAREEFYFKRSTISE